MFIKSILLFLLILLSACVDYAPYEDKGPVIEGVKVETRFLRLPNSPDLYSANLVSNYMVDLSFRSDIDLSERDIEVFGETSSFEINENILRLETQYRFQILIELKKVQVHFPYPKSLNGKPIVISNRFQYQVPTIIDVQQEPDSTHIVFDTMDSIAVSQAMIGNWSQSNSEFLGWDTLNVDVQPGINTIKIPTIKNRLFVLQLLTAVENEPDFFVGARSTTMYSSD